MGLLDIQPVATVAARHDHAFAQALENQGISLSPFALEIIHLLIASYYFEPVDSMEIGEPRRPPYEAIDKLLVEAVEQMVSAYAIKTRDVANGLITAVDVFHWIGDFGRSDILDILCGILPGGGKQR